MAKIGYSARTFGFNKYEVKDYILKALESDSDIRREMQSVISTANKRITRLSQGDIISPSLQSLQDKKFSLHAKSWQDAKQEYARAISFLQQPTSTVTGAKEYGRYIQRSYGLTEEQYKKIGHDIVTKVNSVDEQSFYDKYLRAYKDFSGELEAEAKDVSQQIEDDATRITNTVQQQLDSASERGANAVENAIDDILKVFNDFDI